MMNSIQKVSHRAAWDAKTLQKQSASWVYHLSEDDVQELDRALRQVQARGLVVPNFGAADFPIPNLVAKLAKFKEELNFGLGVLYIRDLPVERYSKDEASAIFWGLGMYIGKPWEQNLRGQLLGDVIDEGKTLDDPTARAYQTTSTLNMHTDGADHVVLFCLKQAPTGGESQIVSGQAVFNKMVEKYPDVARHLVDTEFCIDWRGEEPPGEVGFHKGHIFQQLPFAMSSFALTLYIESAQRHPEARRLTDMDKKALAVFEEVSNDPELVFTYTLKPGDMSFLNNHFAFHGRSSYTDSPDPKEARHLRRLWLEAPEWAEHRPAIMSNILRNSSTNWRKPQSTVRMWDE